MPLMISGVLGRKRKSMTFMLRSPELSEVLKGVLSGWRVHELRPASRACLRRLPQMWPVMFFSSSPLCLNGYEKGPACTNLSCFVIFFVLHDACQSGLRSCAVFTNKNQILSAYCTWILLVWYFLEKLGRKFATSRNRCLAPIRVACEKRIMLAWQWVGDRQ